MDTAGLKPCLLNAQVANLLGLPKVALAPCAQLRVSDTAWLWFDPESGVAIWRSEGLQHGFTAASMKDALTRLRRHEVG